MHLTPEVDVPILMAVALASKRRPAELVEVVAAADLIQGFAPAAEKLGEAMHRLSVSGLVVATAEGVFTLTPAAEAVMEGQPRKGDMAARIAVVKGNLAAYAAKAESPAIRLTAEQLVTAIRAHKAARRTPVKNLAMPKPKADRHFKVDGRWRRASGRREGKP